VKLQRVAAILNPALPWHEAVRSREDLEASGISIDTVASYAEDAAAREQHAAEVEGWLGMGAEEQRTESPLWRWNEACRLLATKYNGAVSETDADITEVSMGAMVPRKKSQPCATQTHECFRVDPSAQLPRLFATSDIVLRIAGCRGQGRAPPRRALQPHWIDGTPVQGCSPLLSPAAAVLARIAQRWIHRTVEQIRKQQSRATRTVDAHQYLTNAAQSVLRPRRTAPTVPGGIPPRTVAGGGDVGIVATTAAIFAVSAAHAEEEVAALPPGFVGELREP
jgi:hypothetical protein